MNSMNLESSTPKFGRASNIYTLGTKPSQGKKMDIAVHTTYPRVVDAL